TILGTFLTRSGTITSVHSFTQSAIGPVLLAFLVLVLAGSFALFATRSHLVSSAPRLNSFASREGAFLANNLLLTAFALVVLVGAAFWRAGAAPLSSALRLPRGLRALTPGRSASGRVVWSRLRGPLGVALAARAVSAVATTRSGWVVLAVVAAVCGIGVLGR